MPIAGILELRHGKLDTLALGASLMGTSEATLPPTPIWVPKPACAYWPGSRPELATPRSADWHDAVVKFSGLGDAGGYIARIYKILRYGGSFPARDGETTSSRRTRGSRRGSPSLRRREQTLATPELPGLEWFQTDCSGKCNTNRPDGNASVDTVLIHDTEGGWDASVATLQFDSGKSVHYIIDADGSRWGQFVPESYTAWHAGNYCYNKHSVGIEHVGVASDTSGLLRRALREERGDGEVHRHALAHRDRPRPHRRALPGPQRQQHLRVFAARAASGSTPASRAPTTAAPRNHRDPGYYWQWCQYMERLGSSCRCNDAWSPVELHHRQGPKPGAATAASSRSRTAPTAAT